MSVFTPTTGLLGGSLIGLSAATLLLFNGDILGASGLASSLVVSPRKTFTDPSQTWKLSFLAAFWLTSRLYIAYVDKDALKDPSMNSNSEIPIVSSLGFIAGGFLVGFGTRLGNGCTTGHGICGMARLSIRSFAAVGAFMATGIFMASGCSPTCPFYPYLRTTYDSVTERLPTESTLAVGTALASVMVGAALKGLLRKAPDDASAEEKEELENDKLKIIPSIVSAAFFSLGLVISNMTISSKIYGFLNMKGIKEGTWDPTLVCVMGGGFLVSFISYQWVAGFNLFKNSKAIECPLGQEKECGKFNVTTNKTIDNNLVIGEALFGLGWGAAGLCPGTLFVHNVGVYCFSFLTSRFLCPPIKHSGPAMFLACAGYPNVLMKWWPSFFVGALLAEKVKAIQSKATDKKNN
jgi:uncharacterized membrane protein YedE/YeeE